MFFIILKYYVICNQNIISDKMDAKKLLIGLLLLCLLPVAGFASDYLRVKPKLGDGIETLLDRYALDKSACNASAFLEINQLSANASLLRHKTYELPIKVYQYNGQSIRSTIGVDDWDLAVEIASYNDDMVKRGLKKNAYKKDHVLWVPIHFLDCYQRSAKTTFTSATMVNAPILGNGHDYFKLESNRLSGKVFYLVAGHGGPDPGALGKSGEATLCEDEYAYDVVLRLAKNLMAHGAEVDLVIQDPNDGIRSESFLDCDHDEQCINGQSLPLNQLKRLQQRSIEINNRYVERRKNGQEDQIAVMIHVDSRSANKKQDVYFYHLKDSESGKKVANKLYSTFKSKYRQYRSSGHYNGSVNSRNLYMLRTTYPPAVFIELGNLRNPNDQKRIILESNRQALANWLFEGLTGISS